MANADAPAGCQRYEKRMDGRRTERGSCLVAEKLEPGIEENQCAGRMPAVQKGMKGRRSERGGSLVAENLESAIEESQCAGRMPRYKKKA
jgi:hypothetical protein